MNGPPPSAGARSINAIRPRPWASSGFWKHSTPATAEPRLLLGKDPGYLAAVLPAGARIWQAAGSNRPELGLTPESHAVALIELKDGRRIAMAVFLSGSTASAAAREAIIAETGRTVLKSF